MTWEKNNYWNADILFLYFISVQTTPENNCDSVRRCCSVAEPAAPPEDFYFCTHLLGWWSLNRDNKSSLGMVAMGNDNNLANKLFNFSAEYSRTSACDLFPSWNLSVKKTVDCIFTLHIDFNRENLWKISDIKAEGVGDKSSLVVYPVITAVIFPLLSCANLLDFYLSSTFHFVMKCRKSFALRGRLLCLQHSSLPFSQACTQLSIAQC